MEKVDETPIKHHHTSLVMLTGIWLAFFICVPLVHHMTLPPMPWTMAIKFVGLLCTIMSLFFGIIGILEESIYKNRIGREMLAKLQENVK